MQLIPPPPLPLVTFGSISGPGDSPDLGLEFGLGLELGGCAASRWDREWRRKELGTGDKKEDTSTRGRQEVGGQTEGRVYGRWQENR